MNIHEAVRSLREVSKASQQTFATRLGISLRALANYEKDRRPSPRALNQFRNLAEQLDQPELALLFTRELGNQLGVGQKEVPFGYAQTQQIRDLRAAFDRCIIEHPDSKDAKAIKKILDPYVKQLVDERKAMSAAMKKV